MLIKTEQPALVADDWPEVFVDFENVIKPFAEKIGAQTDLRDSDLDILVSYLSTGLENWFTHLLGHEVMDLRARLANARQRAAVFKEGLESIASIPAFLRADVVGPELPDLIKLLERDQWLQIYSGKQHFGELMGLVCCTSDPFYETCLRIHLPASVQRKVNRLTGEAISAREKGDVKRSEELFLQRDELADSALRPKRGRRRGMRKHPQLDRLVFNLAYAVAWARFTLSAYVKQSGKAKVAVGTLIDILNSLREHLAQDPNWRWLTDFLPLQEQHQYYVATYRRLCVAAWSAFGDD